MTIAGFVLAAMGYASDPRAGWLVALIVGGQALSLGSMSFAPLEQPGRGAATEEAAPVGARRRHIGLTLLIAHIGLYVLVWFAAVLSYAKASAEEPLPSVFGLSFAQQGPAFVWGVVAAELCFTAAVYALGPQWRHRLKQLFRYQPSSTPAVAEAPGTPPRLLVADDRAGERLVRADRPRSAARSRAAFAGRGSRPGSAGESPPRRPAA